MTTAVTGRRFTTRRLGSAGADPSPGGTLRTIASAPAAPQPGSPFRPGPLHAGHCQRPWRPQRTSSHRQELPGDPSAPRSRCRSAEILHRRCGRRGIARRMTVEWFVSTSWWVFLLTDLAFEPESLPGNGIFRAETKRPKPLWKVQERRCRDKISLNNPAHSD